MSDWAFIEHITNQLMRPRSGDAKHPTLWPSEASATYCDNGETITVGKCKRAMFFRYLVDSYKFYKKYKIWRPLVERLERDAKPPDKYMLWIWAAGNQAEEYLIDQAKKSGVYVSEQVPVYIKSHNISGKKDIESYNPESGKLTIIEAKSVYGFGANNTLGTESQRRRGVMGTPRDSNLMQIAIYHWWSASLDPAYEESRLVYIARDTGRYAEYQVRTINENETIHIEYRSWHPYIGIWKRVPYTINNILENYEYIQKAIDGGIIPPRDYDLKWSEERLKKAYEADELNKTDKKKYEKTISRREENTWIQTLQAIENNDILISSAYSEKERFLAPVRKLLEAYAETNTLINTGPCDRTNLPDGYIAKSAKLKTKLIAALRAIKPKKPLAELEKGDWQCKFCKWATICYDDKGYPQTKLK